MTYKCLFQLRLRFCVSFLISCLGFSPVISGQGTVSFANIGGGVNAPFSNEFGLLGAGFSAHLALVDGTRVGNPAPFLANGLFSGGTRIVKGIGPGESVSLVVAVEEHNGGFLGTSESVEVILGGSGAPPSAPSALAGLQAKEFSSWFSSWGNDGLEIFVDTDLWTEDSGSSTNTIRPENLSPEEFIQPFESMVLAIAVRDQLQKPNHAVLQDADLNQITYLMIDSADFTGMIFESLQGIERLTRLRSFKLDTGTSDLNFTPTDFDLKPLSQLEYLVSLDVRGDSPISVDQATFRGIIGAPSIESLGLYGVGLPAVPDLSQHSDRLSSLSLVRGNISGIELPSTLVELRWLNLGGNQLSEIELPSTLVELWWLDLRGNQLSELSIPPELDKLSSVSTTGNPLRFFRVADFGIIRSDDGVIDPKSIRLNAGEGMEFTAYSSGEVRILRSYDLNDWGEVGRKSFGRGDRFIDRDYSGGNVFYRLTR